MSTIDPMSGIPGGSGRQPSEAELMAAYEEQLKRIRVEEIVVQSLASLIEIGGRRAGLAGGDSLGESDPDQLGLAIEAIKALQPLAAPLLGEQADQVTTALSQLQVAFARLVAARDGEAPKDGEQEPAAAPDAAAQAAPTTPPPAQPAADSAASRLWVPGQ